MSRATSSRPYLFAFAFLALVGLWQQLPQATRPAPALLKPQHARVSDPPAPRRDGVFATTARPAMPAVASNVTRSAVSGADPAPAPFAFLGRIIDDGEAVVLLHRAGRTLKVRGTGRVADDYEVDALMENLVVLRHVPSGTRQLVELTARDPNPLFMQPEDTPRD